MSPRDDLQAVNHALRELVRLQLTGELEAETAWRERRQMLESVEAAWGELVEDAAPVSAPAPEEAPLPAPAATGSAAAWRQKLPTPRAWRLPFWALLLLFALLTFIYVGSL